MNLDEIKRSLVNLTNDELDELAAAINALRQFSSSAPTRALPNTGTMKDMMLRCIHSSLEKQHLSYASVMLYRATSTSVFRDKLEHIDTFLGKGLSKQQRYAILQIGCDLLLRDLSNTGVVVTPGTIARTIHRIPALLNQEFPGYSTSGLLSMLIKRNPKTGER